MDAREETLTISRLRFFARGCVLWGGLITARLVYLQVIQHDEFLRLAHQQQERDVEIQAPRGTLFDRNGQPLAMSLPVDSVCINPLRVSDPAVAADLLSRVLDLDQKALLAKIKAGVESRRGFMWIKRKIAPEESQRLRSYALDWVEFRTESRRFYPKSEVAAHVIGSVDHEERGNAGIELSLNKELQGKAGVMRTMADVKQNVFDLQVFTDPKPGKNVTLTIDERVQFIAQRELKIAAKKFHCKTGSLVVMNPSTGEILAMANYPSYDPNIPPKPGEDLAPRVNLAVSSPFEPGSVFKVITLSAALERTRIRPETIINCGNGRMTLFRRVIHDHHSYASLSMADVLAKSSNIGAINIGLTVGEKQLHSYIQRFGFGKMTGIPLPAESGGLVRRLERWIPSSIGSIAMGHELSATTLQLARACSVVANGGVLVTPRITLKRQRPGQDADVIEKASDPIRVLQPGTTITMRQMMERVVLKGGTGTRARLDGYTAAGKTGSAQIYDFKARAYTHRYNSSFMGFAPLNNPAIVVAITLNGASKMGGEVAAPVFREVASAALRYLDVPKDLPDGIAPFDDGQSPVEDLAIAGVGAEPPVETEDAEPSLTVTTAAASARPTVMLGPALPPSLTPAALRNGPRMPDFQGKTVRTVLEESAALGVRLEFSGSGLARAQAPPAGAFLRQGERVKVQFMR